MTALIQRFISVLNKNNKLDSQTGVNGTFSRPDIQIEILGFCFFRGAFSNIFNFVMTSLVKNRGRIFLDGVWLKNESHGCYKCHEKSCPFAVKLSFKTEGGVEQPTVDKSSSPSTATPFQTTVGS